MSPSASRPRKPLPEPRQAIPRRPPTGGATLPCHPPAPRQHPSLRAPLTGRAQARRAKIQLPQLPPTSARKPASRSSSPNPQRAPSRARPRHPRLRARRRTAAVASSTTASGEAATEPTRRLMMVRRVWPRSALLLLLLLRRLRLVPLRRPRRVRTLSVARVLFLGSTRWVNDRPSVGEVKGREWRRCCCYARPKRID